jgi:hypothetical protein
LTLMTHCYIFFIVAQISWGACLWQAFSAQHT